MTQTLPDAAPVPLSVIRPDQILVTLLFLAVLGAVWLGVRVWKGQGGAIRTTAGRRMKVAEVLALSPADRAMILRVDETEFLVLRLRGAAPVITQLPSVASMTGDAA